MFKRRDPRSYGRIASDMVYPRGGWRRAGTYVAHRLSRLPDQPHRIGRGMAVGIFAGFSPFFGIHFILAAVIAWLIRGNIFAALIGTFICNPLTIPFIAVGSVTIGRALLGLEGSLSPQLILVEFGRASAELWHNLAAIIGPDSFRWTELRTFAGDIFLPYLLGGAILGLIAGVIGHYLTVPVINAYHRRRARRMAERIERLRKTAEGRRPPQ